MATEASDMPYVAVEFAADSFIEEFVVGGGGVGQDDCNDELLPGATYTVFLRAYPESLMGRDEFAGARRRRRQVNEGVESRRQYVVFSSSNFLPPVTTGQSWNVVGTSLHGI